MFFFQLTFFRKVMGTNFSYKSFLEFFFSTFWYINWNIFSKKIFFKKIGLKNKKKKFFLMSRFIYRNIENKILRNFYYRSWSPWPSIDFFYELPMVKFNYYSCNSQNTIEKPVKWLKKKFQKSIFQNKIS